MFREVYDRMDDKERVRLFSSLLGARQAVLVGTANAEGQPNLAIFASMQHFGSRPPLLGLMFRPHTVERHTLENVLATGEFTIGLVHEGIFRQAHETSRRVPRDVSEFAHVGLTPMPSLKVKPPKVLECRLRLELQLVETYHVRYNSTTLVIGEVVHMDIPKEAMDKDGSIKHDAVGTMGCVGNEGYFRVPSVEKLPPTSQV
jgi:flavin reductase (DIM6/NTAB) family NADH-FMN oxidoreductase RutF